MRLSILTPIFSTREKNDVRALIFTFFCTFKKQAPPRGILTARGEKVHFRNATNPIEIKRPEDRDRTLRRLTNKGKTEQKYDSFLHARLAKAEGRGEH